MLPPVFVLLFALTMMTNTSDTTTAGFVFYEDTLLICKPLLLEENVDNNNACEFCMKTIEEFQEMLNDPEFQDEIISMVEELCSMLTFKMELMCQMFVDFYLPELIQQFLESDSHTICQDISLCLSQ